MRNHETSTIALEADQILLDFATNIDAYHIGNGMATMKITVKGQSRGIFSWKSFTKVEYVKAGCSIMSNNIPQI